MSTLTRFVRLAARRALLPILLAVLSTHAFARSESLDLKSTWAVVAGVLEWSDPGLGSFPKKNRKDKELFEKLGALGVPANQRTLLLDSQATAGAIEKALTEAIAKAPADATLIFYFAGHGVKDQSGQIIFTSSETRLDKLDSTGLNLAKLGKLLDRFKGKRLILLADCCYSGGLVDVAATLRAKRPVVALTSAEASNISTGNWTFSQTIIDGVSGRSLFDRDTDGALTLTELADEVKDAMRHRESQRYGYANHGVPDDLVIAASRVNPDVDGRDGASSGELKRRGWVKAPRTDAGKHKGKAIARILTLEKGEGRKAGGKALVEFYDYSDATRTWVPLTDLEPITLQTWPVGTTLDVTWQGQVYQAKVLKLDDGFMYITYPGYDARWDEWISAPRVVGTSSAAGTPSTGAKKKAKVEWKGQWYDAVVNSEEDGKYCISYVGYTSQWDECVGKKRIRF